MSLKQIRESIVTRIFELKVELGTLEQTLVTIDSFSMPEAPQPTEQTAKSPDAVVTTMPKTDSKKSDGRSSPTRGTMTVLDAMLQVGISTGGEPIAKKMLFDQIADLTGIAVAKMNVHGRLSDIKKKEIAVVSFDEVLFDVDAAKKLLNRTNKKQRSKDKAITTEVKPEKPLLIPPTRPIKMKTITKNDVLDLITSTTVGGLSSHDIFNALVKANKHPSMQAINRHLNRLRQSNVIIRNGSGKHYLTAKQTA